MEGFQTKTLVTQRSLKYKYYVSTHGTVTTQTPALFFIHGFPDSAHLWSGVVAHLCGLPNKMIIPDCLGYAGTDKPDDTRLYAYKDQANDLAEILKKEGAHCSIIIGHDWGSVLAQRTYLYRPTLFSGVVLLNTGYMIPSEQPFDLDMVNAATEKQLGYPQFSYWEFLTAPDSAEIIDDNLERMWQVLHGDVRDWMKKLFCVPNAMREFLTGDEEVPLKPYAAQARWKNNFLQQFKKDGFASSLQMYKATMTNVQAASDSTIPKEKLRIGVPLLFAICSQDAVCVPDMMIPAKESGLVPYLKEVVIDCAHWSPMEKPDEIGQCIYDFIKDIKSSRDRY